MINKGKGCISAIFDGSIPIALVKHGLETVFQKPSEPVTPETDYISNGLTAYFSGEDNYVDGAWVDRISGYKFTPVSTSTAPVYDGTNKLYQATAYGGMLSNFKLPASSNYTFEIVTRDIKNAICSNQSSNYAAIVGGEMNNYSNLKDNILITRTANQYNAISINKVSTGATGQYLLSRNDLAENSLDTITIVPEVGYFHNGVKLADCLSADTERGIGLFTPYSGKYVSNYQAKNAKIHAVRLYNRQLTQEEIAHNRTIDEAIYGV